ncbi:MAG: type II secretion system protein GspD [Candidatus Omnitrophica bacterium]|nr:type II secretion system protein GspD [Candidatus Omnitrophota bacterium]
MKRRPLFLVLILVMVSMVFVYSGWCEQNDGQQQPPDWAAMGSPEGIPPPEAPSQQVNPEQGIVQTQEGSAQVTMQEEKPVKASLANAERMIDVLDLKGVDVNDVIKMVAKKSGLNIVASQNVKGQVTVYLRDMKVLEVLKVIVTSYGWAFVQEDAVVKIMTAQEYEERYGRKFGRKYETRIKQLTSAKASEVAALLNQLKTTGGSVIADDKSGTLVLIDDAAALERMENVILKADRPVVSKVFKLSYAKTADIGPKIEAALTPDLGKSRSDERSNTLVVTDSESKMKDIERIVTAFDQKDKQVLIESKIIQITLNNSHQMGVDWEGIVQGYKGLDFKSKFNILKKDTDGKITQGGSLKVGTLSNDDYTALIEALDTVGSTDVLSSPRITTVNNKEAKILVGSTEPYVTSQTTNSGTGPATTAESVNFIEVGIKLYVTPTIHDDGFITMKIRPEISEVKDHLPTGSGNSIPIVQTSQAETNVTVKDGVTIVIGGLMKELATNDVNKIPVLGSIPLLGRLFRNDSQSMEKQEIVLFLKPTIITGDLADQKEMDKYLDK